MKKHCGCLFNTTAIHSERLSCQNLDNTPATHLIFRAILNGSNGFLPTSTAFEYIRDWADSEGAFDYYYFRLRLTSTRLCKLKIESMDVGLLNFMCL